MSIKAQTYVQTVLQQLAGEGVVLNPRLKAILETVLSRQVTVNEDGSITPSSAFDQLAKVFTFVSAPSGDRPSSPNDYDDTALENAKQQAQQAADEVEEPGEEPTTPTFTLAEALDAEELPAEYTLSDATVDLGALAVADVAAAQENAQAIVDGAANAEELTLAATYSLADTLANLEAADAAVLEGAASYTLTNEAGELGALTDEQAALVEGAENAGDYTFTVEFTLTKGLEDLQAAQAAKAAFIENNAENELLGWEEGDDPIADVEAAVAAADTAADTAVTTAEGELQDAIDTLDIARATTATDAGVDVGVTTALDALASNTLLRDATLEAARVEAQEAVTADTMVYAADGTAVSAGHTFDLHNSEDNNEYVDLSGVEADEIGDIIIDLADYDADANNKDDNGGGGNDTIILPDLAGYTGELTIENMILGNNSSKGYDTLVAPGLADAVSNVAVVPAAGGYLDVTLTTDAGGEVAFTNLIKAETLAEDLVDQGLITADNAASFGVTLADADADPAVEFAVTDDATFATGLQAALNGPDYSFAELLEGYGNLKATASTTGLDQVSFSAADLQQAAFDADAALEADIATNGDDFALLDEVRVAINAHVGAGGTNYAVADVGGDYTNIDLLDLRTAIVDVLAMEAGDDKDAAAEYIRFEMSFADYGPLVEAPEGGELTPAQQASNARIEFLNGLYADIFARQELIDSVSYADDAFAATSTGGVLNAVVALQEERQALIDAVPAAEDALADAQATAEATQALVDELAGLNDDVAAAEEALTEAGFVVSAWGDAATAEGDIYIYEATDTEIAGFGAEGEDVIFLGDTAFELFVAEDGSVIADNLGDVSALEIIVIDNGTDTTLYFEAETFAGNSAGDADMAATVELTGVTGAEFAINDGFLTIA